MPRREQGYGTMRNPRGSRADCDPSGGGPSLYSRAFPHPAAAPTRALLRSTLRACAPRGMHPRWSGSLSLSRSVFLSLSRGRASRGSEADVRASLVITRGLSPRDRLFLFFSSLLLLLPSSASSSSSASSPQEREASRVPSSLVAYGRSEDIEPYFSYKLFSSAARVADFLIDVPLRAILPESPRPRGAVRTLFPA